MPELDFAIHGNLRQPLKRGKLQTLIGRKDFNRLTPIGFLGMIDNQAQWLCLCSCRPGRFWVATAQRLKNGQSQSCGCWNYDKPGPSTTHGKSKSRIHSIYSGMRTRIYNLKNHSSRNHGRKGITMCEGFDTFEKFYTIVGEPTSEIHSIDRYPLKRGGYWCGECADCKSKEQSKNWRWATPKEQSRNTVVNVMLTYNNETRCASEWAEILGISPSTIANRRRRKLSDAECLGFKEPD